MRRAADQVTQTIHCLDLFGASERVAASFRASGYQSIAYDIKLNSQHDLCTKAGVEALLRMGMM